MPQSRSPRGRSPRLRSTAAVAITVAGLGLSACSSSPNPVGPAGDSTSASPSASPTPSASSSGPVAPLTGLPAASAAAAGRPAVALDLAGPDPAGLTSADLVFQEFSAPTRYIAVFQSKTATAGPITGTQPTDGAAVSVLHPLIGYDGGLVPYFVSSLDKSTLKDAGYSRYPALYTQGSQGLTVSTQTIMNTVTGETAPPPLFEYRGADSGTSTLAATGLSRPTTVQVTIPGNGTQTWTFDQGADRWILTSGGPRVEVANVVVQTVAYKQLGNAHAGLTTESAQLVGSGHAEVLSGSVSGGSGGTAASGTWSRPHLGKVTVYLDSSAAPMAFQPGPTWIVLAPSGTQVSTSG
jgi:Protein of unknown function (DUF3048) C-terminal domain